MVYGVGIGVGDPELITLKALRVIRESDVIVLPAADGKNSRAYASVKEVYKEIDEKELICFEFPMTRDKKTLEERRDRISESIRALDAKGNNVAMLVIGDPNIYATYSYIEQRLKKAGVQCESISGINSFTASAAALGIPLVKDDEELHVIPGSADIEDALRLKGTKVFMKLSGDKQSRLYELLAPLEEKGLVEVYAAEKCGLDDEKLLRGLKEIAGGLAYLSTVIVKERHKNER